MPSERRPFPIALPPARLRRWLAACLPALLLAGWPRPSLAHPSGAPMLRGGPRLAAGQVVEIRWALPPGEVEELEILLSVDGGRRYDLRVSPELDGHEDRFLWRVPNLSTSEARLRLRMRVDGRELVAEPGEPFEISGDPGSPPDLDQVHEGNWWTGPDGGSNRCPVATLVGSAECGVGPPDPRPLEIPPRALIERLGAHRLRPAASESITRSHTPSDLHNPALRFVPSRE